MRRAAIVAVVLFAGACGDDAGVSAVDYPTVVRDAQCERLARCGVYPTKDACVAHRGPRSDQPLLAAIDAGLLIYSNSHLDLCLKALATQSCDTTSQDARMPLTACDGILTGELDDGESCAFPEECVSGKCNVGSCLPNTCCNGTCQPTIVDAAIDATCGRNEDCAAGLYCGDDMLCHALLIDRDMCKRDSECAFDLACVGATETDLGRCRDLPAIGESCPYMRCADIGAACLSGTCVALGFSGAPCMNESDCEPDARCSNLTCAPIAHLGEPCEEFCTDQAWCNQGTCTSRQEDGAPCAADDECVGGFCEDGPVFEYCTKTAVCI